MRGLRTPLAGCALKTLLVAPMANGRARDSKKHGKLSGLGRALIKVSVSAIVCGELETPAGARQPGVGLRPGGRLGFELGLGLGSELGSLQPTMLDSSSQAHKEERTSERITAGTYEDLAQRKMRHHAARRRSDNPPLCAVLLR